MSIRAECATRRLRTTSIIMSALALLSSGIAAQAQDAASRAAGDDSKTEDPRTTIAVGEIVTELDDAIFHVLQAKNGDYWFGSREQGAYRYDGKTLVLFTKRDGLCYDGVGGIQEDEAGNLYFTTSEWDAEHGFHKYGLSRFDGTKFVTMDLPGKDAPLGTWALDPDDLWFGGGQDSGCIYRYDGRTIHRLEFPKTPEGDAHFAAYPRSKYPNAKYSPYDIYLSFKDSKGNLWFGTATLGACRFDGKSFSWLSENELRNGAFGTRSIVEDKNGSFWFCDTLHRYDVDLSDPASPQFRKREGLFDTSSPKPSHVEGIMSSVLDPSGTLWMATYGMGVWRWDEQGLTRFPVKDGEKDIHLFSIYRDLQGVLWLGTQASGVYKFNGASFVRFRP